MTEKELNDRGIFIEDYIDGDEGKIKYILGNYSLETPEYAGKSLQWTDDGPIINDPFESKEEALDIIGGAMECI